ncbi:MAG: hypothetical protein H6Q48_2591 [Deltaproteobacteria bacterium]|nr:hypothetical protein [Deltaproteobacteria bacterium]
MAQGQKTEFKFGAVTSLRTCQFPWLRWMPPDGMKKLQYLTRLIFPVCEIGYVSDDDVCKKLEWGKVVTFGIEL